MPTCACFFNVWSKAQKSQNYQDQVIFSLYLLSPKSHLPKHSLLTPVVGKTQPSECVVWSNAGAAQPNTVHSIGAKNVCTSTGRIALISSTSPGRKG